MLPDEMEAEKNRKMILAQADEIDILKKNVNFLEGQLRDAYERIKELKETELYYKKLLGVDRQYGKV